MACPSRYPSPDVRFWEPDGSGRRFQWAARQPIACRAEVAPGPVAWPRTPGVMFGRYRTVAFDGCRSIKVPDTPRNRAWVGKLTASLGETG